MSQLLPACLECIAAVLHGRYSPPLVVLSVLIAAMASYTAFDLAGRVTSTPGLARRVWLIGGATMMGLGIWSTHFVGLLAFTGPMNLAFDVPLTAVSMLVSALGAGTALFVVTRRRVTRAHLVAGGVFMGLAMTSMHYMGMMALRTSALVRYRPGLAVASVALAILSSLVALAVAFRLRREQAQLWDRRKLASALLMGLAIVGMHYTMMAAVSFEYPEVEGLGAGGVAITSLGGFAIGAASLVGLCLTLLTSLVDLERRRASAALRFLADASLVLARSLDPRKRLETLAGLLVPDHADCCIVELLEEGGVSVRESVVYVKDPAHARAARLEAERRQALGVPVGTALAQLVRTGQSLVASEVQPAELERVADDPLWRQVLRQMDVRAYLVVPLVVREQVRGSITLLSCRRERVYLPADVSLFEDLGRRAGTALENARLYQDAQEAIRARDEFLSIASHELRTPLTPLQLHLQSLRRTLEVAGPDGVSVEVISGKLEVAERQEKRLARLVSELLDLSCIRLGHLELRPAELDLAALTQGVVDRLCLELHQAGCPVTVSAPEPVLGAWDRARLEQVVGNLVRNALRYGQDAPVEVEVFAREGRAHLVVHDHGIGIAPEHQRRIFERFERAASRNFGGLGLGLYIVRQVVEAHGGSIHLSSELGVGSTFTVELPLHRH